MSDDEPGLGQLSDEELWQAYVGGDDAAFAEVRRRYEGSLYWYLVLSLSSPRRAAEGLVKVMGLAAAYRLPHSGFDSLKGWLYAIATQTVVPARAGEEFGLTDLLEDLKRQPAQSKREEALRALGDLKGDLRQPLLLVTVADLSIRETTKACNCTREQTADRIEKACRVLMRSEHFSAKEGCVGL